MTMVLISGLGLIGSSIARIMRESQTDVEIIGADPDDDAAAFLLSRQIINKHEPFSQAAPKADVIVLAGPVSVIIAQIETLAHLSLKSNLLVTDVGSTKVEVMQAAENLRRQGIGFLGGHPMAGSHLVGAQNGTTHLFSGSKYFLVTGSQTKQQLSEFQKLMKAGNVDWTMIDAQTHDKLVSELSHVPHVIAATLVNTVADSVGNDPVGLTAAAGGFKSTTRIAASDPKMWTAIMMSNSEEISSEIADFKRELTEFQQAISSRNEEKIIATFTKAQKIRKSLDE